MTQETVKIDWEFVKSGMALIGFLAILFILIIMAQDAVNNPANSFCMKQKYDYGKYNSTISSQISEIHCYKLTYYTQTNTTNYTYDTYDLNGQIKEAKK